MNPLEQIDFVFFYIKQSTFYGGSIGYHNIENYVVKTPEKEITITLLKEIIKRLKVDGYISEATPDNSQPLYHLSFQGFLFEGYKKAQENVQKENEHVKSLSQRTLQLSERMDTLTIWIAVATVVASLYSLLEILDKFFCIYPQK